MTKYSFLVQTVQTYRQFITISGVRRWLFPVVIGPVLVTASVAVWIVLKHIIVFRLSIVDELKDLRKFYCVLHKRREVLSKFVMQKSMSDSSRAWSDIGRPVDKTWEIATFGSRRSSTLDHVDTVDYDRKRTHFAFRDLAWVSFLLMEISFPKISSTASKVTTVLDSSSLDYRYFRKAIPVKVS